MLESTKSKTHLLSSKDTIVDNSQREKYIIDINKYHPNNLNQPRIPSDHLNEISTTKYTFYNFIFKILLEQFMKISNIYFLVISVMQCFKEISNNKEGRPNTLIPLLIVVCINGVKDFHEDWKRKKSDDEENSKKIEVFNLDTASFETKKWEEVMVGNIIKVKENEFFPADCVLLGSSEKQNNCYVETKNLDGETNLKFKKALSQIVDSLQYDDNNPIEKQFANFKGTLTTQEPNEFIYEFNAVFNFDVERDKNQYILLSPSLSKEDAIATTSEELPKEGKDVIVISNESFLLRGSSLKQTEYIYGMVVYTGHNTKIMKNSPSAKSKISSIEHKMNFEILLIFILQILFSFLGAAFCLFKLNVDKVKISYLEDKNAHYGFIYFLLRLATWVVHLNNLVPISLLMTVEMVKYIQGMFIQWDYQLYDREKRIPAKVQTSTLNEELGQVKYIFSDKTGTLTKNYMQFKMMAIGEKNYGTYTGINDIDGKKQQYKDEYGDITNFSFNDAVFNDHLSNWKSIHDGILIDLFMTCIATCHSIITNEKQQKQGVLSYQSSSPDETALVNCARYFKYIFNGRDIDNNIYIIKNGVNLKYEELCNFPYTSERKRMSIIVRTPENKIYLFIKGADNILLSRAEVKLSYIDKMNEYIKDYAEKGLRTLVIGYREITEQEFSQINIEYTQALQSTYDKEKLLDELSNRVDTNIHILGITGIEDQLQDNVGEVLKSFNHSGIKIWVLTGDKKDTAKSIAYSCGLLNEENFTIYDFKEGMNKDDLRKYLQKIINDYNQSIKDIDANRELKKSYAILISQLEFQIILNHRSLLSSFYEVANRCNSVLCCRVTPKQKAQVVKLIKEFQPNATTLAIGDGANDVNMITSANIGIGIIGVEGRQAARASDYAIGEFQFLKQLLFVHGRESYRKNSFVVCFNFYKNFLFVIPQFILGFESLFSGQAIYDPFIYQLYNIVYASFPIMWFGIYDQQYIPKKLIENPRYYTQGIMGRLFGPIRFWKWIFYGTVQALVIYIFSFHLVGSAYSPDGNIQDITISGSISYSLVVIIVNIKVLQATSSHSWISITITILSILLYYASIAVFGIWKSYYIYGNCKQIMGSMTYYLKVICVLLICLLMDFGIKTFFKIFGCIPDPLDLNPEDMFKQDEIEVKGFEYVKNDENIESNGSLELKEQF